MTSKLKAPYARKIDDFLFYFILTRLEKNQKIKQRIFIIKASRAKAKTRMHENNHAKSASERQKAIKVHLRSSANER